LGFDNFLYIPYNENRRARQGTAAEGHGCGFRRLATPLRKGVKRVWKNRLYFVLRFLVCLAFALYILTINAR
jgi:hypothetical protein